MGAGSSKASPDASQHVFAADGPVSFSQSVIDSLQSSPETDSTRSRNIELQIESRLTAELEKIRDHESALLAAKTQQVTSDTESSEASDDPSLGEKISSALTPGSQSSDSERSRDSVSKEIAELKSKLNNRKKLEKVDPAVEKAKSELVGCLRMNDRRPLDCWEQVETFKREVAKLEQKFVEKAMR